MKYPMQTIIPAVLALLVGIGSAAVLVRSALEEETPPQLPARATGVRGLLLARPFLLEQEYEHCWRAEAPRVRGGFLLVLEVDHPFTVPRNTLESVLYVGEQTAERINWGSGSGRVVAVVPTPLDEDGAPRLDWSRTPIWYGAPELPERVDEATVQAELAAARGSGIVPLDEKVVSAALEHGGELLRLPSRFELDRYAAGLILEYSPTEAERAEGMLVPQVE